MADVTLKYKGATIGELSETGNKTIKTAGKYCEADILLNYIKQSGGLVKKTGSFVLDADYTYIQNANVNYTGSILIQTGLKTIQSVFMYDESYVNKTADANCWGATIFYNSPIPFSSTPAQVMGHGSGASVGYANGNWFQTNFVAGPILNDFNSSIPVGAFGWRNQNATFPIKAGHVIRWEAIGTE